MTSMLGPMLRIAGKKSDVRGSWTGLGVTCLTALRCRVVKHPLLREREKCYMTILSITVTYRHHLIFADDLKSYQAGLRIVL